MQSPFTNLPPVVKNLLIINILCFLPSVYFTHNFAEGFTDPVSNYFGLHYFNSIDFKPWQILTYMFLHGGWAHILFNMFALFSFGPILEYSIGSKKFFTLYFACGLGAGLIQLFAQGYEVYHLTGGLSVPMAGLTLDQFYAQYGLKLTQIFFGSTVGASGAIFGLLVGFGMLYPNMELMIMFIPVPIKAKYIIPIYCIFEVVMGFGQFAGDDVAHFAHIGGAIIGFILIKAWKTQRPNSLY